MLVVVANPTCHIWQQIPIGSIAQYHLLLPLREVNTRRGMQLFILAAIANST